MNPLQRAATNLAKNMKEAVEAVDASSGDVWELAAAKVGDVQSGQSGQPGQPGLPGQPGQSGQSGQRSQRQRLLESRRLQAEFQKKLLQRKVDESRLSEQSQWTVYGAALAASCLSTAVMHPVDTVKVRGGR